MNFKKETNTLRLPVKRQLVFLMLLTLFSFSISAQTFSYATPICQNTGPVSPAFTLGFPSGGVFSAVPAPGLSINQNSGDITPALSTAGTYTIYYTGSTCGCTLTAVLTIHSLSSLSIDNASICASSSASSLVLTANPSSGFTYTWSNTPVNTPTIAVYPPFGFGQSYTVMATDANGCINQASAQISVIAGPALIISGPSTVCPGASAGLTVNGATNYTWSPGNSNNASITVSPAVTTVYTATGSSGSGCTSSVSKTITVASFSLTANSQTVCSGRSVSLTASSNPNTGVSYVWYPGAYVGPSIAVSPSSSRNYTVVGTRGGCSQSVVVSVSVSLSFTPNTVFSYKYPLCTNSPDQQPTLDPGFSPGGSFSSLPASIDINDTTGAVSFSAIAAGDYYIYYTKAAVGCTAATTGTAELVVGQSGKLDITPDLIILKGSSALLSVSGGVNYNWTPNLYINCNNCDTPTVAPPETTQYCVSSDLCIDGGCVNVTVLCKNEGDLSVPNAFTPNNDGNNDKFCLQGWTDCNKSFEIIVFDRWGEKVFESDKPDFCWDGKFNGQLLTAGDYTYVITASFEMIPKAVKKGIITIIH